MKEFDKLKALIGSIIELDSSLFLNEEFQSDDRSLSIKLIGLIKANKDLKLEEVYHELYGHENKVAIRKLLSRTTARIYDFLVQGKFLSQSRSMDDRARLVFQLEKKLLLSDILRYRGLYSHSEELLNEVIGKAKEIEHFDLLLFGLSKKVKSVSYSLTMDSIKQVESEIEHFHKCGKYLNRANRLYYQYLYGFNDSLNEDVIESLKAAIVEVEGYYAFSKSIDIFYYLTFLRVALFTIEKNYNACIKELEHLYRLLSESSKLQSRLKIGNVIINLAYFNRLVFNFNLSLLYLENCEKYLSSPKPNTLYVYEQYFLTYLFSNDLEKSSYYFNLFMEILSCDKYKTSIQRKAAFYSICMQYIREGKFPDWNIASNSLFKVDDLLSVYLKLYKIMDLIGKEKFDLADYEIDSFRKYISRLQSKIQLTSRMKLILKLFFILPRCSYSFALVIRKHNKYFKELQHLSNAWTPNSYELIALDEWFYFKSKNENYSHPIAMLRTRQLYFNENNDELLSA